LTTLHCLNPLPFCNTIWGRWSAFYNRLSFLCMTIMTTMPLLLGESYSFYIKYFMMEPFAAIERYRPSFRFNSETGIQS
jgi:hypothetical protein